MYVSLIAFTYSPAIKSKSGVSVGGSISFEFKCIRFSYIGGTQGNWTLGGLSSLDYESRADNQLLHTSLLLAVDGGIEPLSSVQLLLCYWFRRPVLVHRLMYISLNYIDDAPSPRWTTSALHVQRATLSLESSSSQAPNVYTHFGILWKIKQAIASASTSRQMYYWLLTTTP